MQKMLTDFSPSPVDEPWRCRCCDKLIYNLDADGHPAPGAPMPKYLNHDWPSVCSLCYDLGSVIRDSMYWKTLQEGKGQK